MTMTNNRPWPWWIWLTIVVLLAFGIGWRGPWPADEPRFAQIALEMVRNHHWLLPHRGGELYPDKPPLFMWAIAGSYLLTHNMKVAFLLPSLVSALLTIVLTYDLARRYYGYAIAQRVILLLLGTLQFTLQAKTAQIDMMVCTFITLGNYGLLRFVFGSHSWRWYYLAWLAMGLGVITKGVGFLPILMALPLWLTRHWQPPQPQAGLGTGRGGKLNYWGGPVVMLLAIGCWVGPMLYTIWHAGTPELLAYRDNILFKQTAVRYAHSLGHQHPFWYFILNVIPLFWLPLSLLLPALIKRFWQAKAQRQRLTVVCASWAALVLLFFSLSPGKRGVYILPALPMLALAAGSYLAELWSKRWSQWTLRAILLSTGGALFISAIIGLSSQLTLPVSVDNTRSLWLLVGTMGGVLLVASIYSLTTIWRDALFAISCCWLLYSSWGYKIMDPWRSDQRFMLEVAHRLPAKGELAIVAFKEQQLLFSDRPITHFGFHTSSKAATLAARDWLSQAPSQRFLLLPTAAAAQCWSRQQWQNLETKHGEHWVLVAGNQHASCNQPAPPLPLFQAPAGLAASS